MCGDGEPCAVRPRVGEAFEGLCMTPEFCMDLAGADLPFTECRYSDLTTLDVGPAAGACPPSIDERTPFCGGSCGSVACPQATLLGEVVPTACVGVSDTRPFGVCPLETVATCGEGFNDWAFCEMTYGEPCACMVLGPRADDVEDVFGFVVMRRACVAYRDEVGASVDCRDYDWRSIEP